MKLSGDVFCFQALQTLCSHWPSIAVHHQCQHPQNRQPENPRESDGSHFSNGVSVALTICDNGSVHMLPSSFYFFFQKKKTRLANEKQSINTPVP